MLKTMNKWTVAYDNSLRMLLGIPKYCSASEKSFIKHGEYEQLNYSQYCKVS